MNPEPGTRSLMIASSQSSTSMKTEDHFSERHYSAGHRVSGPVGFLNPTTRYFLIERRRTEPLVPEPRPLGPSISAPPPQAYHVWRSRDNRKGRHSAAIGPEYVGDGRNQTPEATNTWRGAWKGIKKMVVRFPVWDVSYDVAVVFTIGSIVWCFNGFFVWLPLAAPATEFKNEESWGGGLTAFIGATIFELGSVLLMLEAVNENRAECFGWALEEAWESGVLSLYTEPGHKCRHHHIQKGSFLNPGGGVSFVGEGETQEKGGENGERGKGEAHRKKRRWSWWPSWYELKTHYFREIGFLACFSQFVGATIFWISGITSLPSIQDMMSTRLSNCVYWLPQVIGGSGFIISSALFMIEVQTRWWKPNLKVLGWHVGFWNLVGAAGFTLCGALGFGIEQPGVEYALTLSTFVGSWAFLIGSLIQWFESLNKYPISVEKDISTISDADGKA